MLDQLGLDCPSMALGPFNCLSRHCFPCVCVKTWVLGAQSKQKQVSRKMARVSQCNVERLDVSILELILDFLQVKLRSRWNEMVQRQMTTQEKGCGRGESTHSESKRRKQSRGGEERHMR